MEVSSNYFSTPRRSHRPAVGMLAHRRSSSSSKGDRTGKIELHSAPGGFLPIPIGSLPRIISRSEEFAQAVEALRPLMPPSCCIFGLRDIQLIDHRPFAAGGFADIWGAEFHGRKVALKSYRCYTSSGSPLVEVHCNCHLRGVAHC